MVKTILFDLDGSLLPMDQEAFIRAYFGALTDFMRDIRSSELLVKVVWAGTDAMVRNDGSATNEEVFWKLYRQSFGDEAQSDAERLVEFYDRHFCAVKAGCGYNNAAAELVAALRCAGYRLVLASNPVFPMTAQKQRMEWAGLDPNDFDYITSYENSCYCKPSTGYYAEILRKIGAEPHECLMVGNDMVEDAAAEKVGIKVFLLKDCLIEREGKDISNYPCGGFEELKEFIFNS